MRFCSEECIPCCDFCKHAIQEKVQINGVELDGGPIGCYKHPDKEHQVIAVGCSYCNDFECFRIKGKRFIEVDEEEYDDENMG